MSILMWLTMEIKTSHYFLLSYHIVILNFSVYSLSTAWNCKSLNRFHFFLEVNHSGFIKKFSHVPSLISVPIILSYAGKNALMKSWLTLWLLASSILMVVIARSRGCCWKSSACWLWTAFIRNAAPECEVNLCSSWPPLAAPPLDHPGPRGDTWEVTGGTRCFGQSWCSSWSLLSRGIQQPSLVRCDLASPPSFSTRVAWVLLCFSGKQGL